MLFWFTQSFRASELQSSRGKNYLPTIFLLLLTIIISPQVTIGQIMYNKVKPYSYQSEELLPVNQLPTLEYNVSSDGNLSIDNLIVNVKEKALLEKKGDKYVSRLKFKVNARKLGEISLYFKDVRLANGTTCYVYTTDYQIVAGPITQQSINANYLTIMKLPADELILEIVFNSEDDYDFTLSGVNYFSAFEKKGYDKPELQSSNCHICPDGVVDHADNVDFLSVHNCNWLGWGHNYEIFNLQKLKGINNYQYDASRSSCIIMVPKCDEQHKYGGKNGTLMNFPYEDCEISDECGQGFIFTVYHEGEIQDIVNAQLNINPENPDTEFLDNVLIRFNWHHKYGTPWHLKGIDYNCDVSVANFEKWRNTIDFSEVIDYCGVRVFAYRPYPGSGMDITILKMNQKPFYKEYHLGWSAQGFFNVDDNDSDSDDYYNALNNDEFKIIGRRAITPTSLIENYNVAFQSYDYNDEYQTEYNNLIRFHPFDALSGDILHNDYGGYSGSQITIADFNNPNERIGLGLITQQHIVTDYTTRKYLFGCSYYSYFYGFDANYKFIDECYNSGSNQRMSTFYFSQSQIASQIQNEPYTHYFGSDSTQSNRNFMPSVENKQHCQSKEWRNPVTEEYDPCEFIIGEYMNYTMVDDEICITFNEIPPTFFPNDIGPSGYRIYYNFGDQQTIKFDSYTDQGDNISFPYTYCISKCEQLYFLALGFHEIEIAVDFYDMFGRILNNPNCEFKRTIPLSLEFCSMFDVDVEKISTQNGCCTYEITLSFGECTKNNPILLDIIPTMKFKSFKDGTPIDISSLTYALDHYELDYENGELRFRREICSTDVEDISSFQFFFDNGTLACESEPIDFTACNCNCPGPEVMMHWFSVVPNPGEPGTACDEDNCLVSLDLDIPGFYGCYNFYKINDGMLTPIPADGKLLTGPYSMLACLEKGEEVTFEIKIFRNPADQEPCSLNIIASCPEETEFEPCAPPPCKEPETTWTEPLPEQFDYPDCTGCKYEVEYRYRTNICSDNSRTQDLQILKLKLIGETCATCPGVSPISMKDLQEESIKRLILNNPMGFLPILTDPGMNCNNTWRVILASCWAEYALHNAFTIDEHGNLDNAIVFSPCDGAGCCMVGMEVCRYTNPDRITITPLSSQGGAVTCSTLTKRVINPATYGIPQLHYDIATQTYLVTYYSYMNVVCDDRCNDLFFIQDNGYGKEAEFDWTYNHKFEDIEISSSFKNEILHSQVICHTECSELTIGIYSIHGQLLFEQDFNVKKGINDLILNLNDFKTGMYLIRYSSGGSYQSAEKLIIVK